MGNDEGGNRREGPLARLMGWFDSRLGLSHQFLRPAPNYSLNPFYWLGALTVVAFVIQGITGIILALYYVPSPDQAYPSTLYIINTVSYGRFLQTVHLYTAYAMIMLAFMHMMRGYFVSVQKKPRELMWVVGMAMGFVTLGFGFTGYLLPWTVVSKSATDVGVGMIKALPSSIASFLIFLIEGAGGDPTELLRFYDLHVIVLPAALLLLLTLKMYMLESHGISEPMAVAEETERDKKLVPIFPDVTLYLLQLATIFGAGMLLISAVFPLTLPPEFSLQTAGQSVVQPEWYFLWIYQVLKFSIFEGPGLTYALSLVAVIFLVLIFLPFIDRGATRKIRDRPIYVTLGAIFVVEVVALAVWGLLTPGQVISSTQGALVLGGIAILVAGVSLGMYRLIFGRVLRGVPVTKVIPGPVRSKIAWTSVSFVVILITGSLSIGTLINSVVNLALGGFGIALLEQLILSLFFLSCSSIAAVYLLYRLDLGTGRIRRRIKAFEVGWRNRR
jgi:ubiquinol-cytochrome c reductase cytochrome b subunit